MEFTTATQKLASYKLRKSDKSKEVLEKGIPLLNTNGFAKQGDEGKLIRFGTDISWRELHRSLGIGWESIERLALAALDEGDIGVADVRP